MSRFIIKRPAKKILDLEKPTVKRVINRILAQEKKTIDRVKKKAKKENIELSEIHHELTLYAMRTHIAVIIKDIMKKKI